MHFYPTLIHAGFIGLQIISMWLKKVLLMNSYKGFWNKTVIFFINFVFLDKYFMTEHFRQIRDNHLTMNYFNQEFHSLIKHL